MKFAAIVLILLLSCDVSSPKDVNKSLIKDIFYEIESSFRIDNLEEIVTHYHPDYKHNEDTLIDVEVLWSTLRGYYMDIDFFDLEITLNNNNWAVVSFELALTPIDESDIPDGLSEELGDLFYFVKEGGVWLICGKDFADILF